MRNEAVKSGWQHLSTACETCAIRLNDLPHLCYQQVGSSEYRPEAVSGLGSSSEYALKALATGLDLGSTTCVRSNPSRAVPVSNTALLQLQGVRMDGRSDKLKDSGIAILFWVVHHFNSMKLLSKTCLHLFQKTLERQREVADSQITQFYGTWGHSLTRKLPIYLKTVSPISLYISKSVTCRP